jgi:UDP-N-acetylmuramate--alanine ligase
MLLSYRRIHFVGVGGVGMVALAEVLSAAGHTVTGSDLANSPTTRRLQEMGITVFRGHSATNAAGTDLVVASSAVPADNPELVRARAEETPVWKRAELLGALTRARRSILVSGTHGKTTTSAMIAQVLSTAGLSPTFLVGGDLLGQGTGARLGTGPLLVAEADEFDRSFLKMSPWMAVVTNVEADHLDYYRTLDAIVEAFQQFIATVPAGGLAILGIDSILAAGLAPYCKGRVVTYGMDTTAEWHADCIKANQRGGNDFQVWHSGSRWGEISLQTPGRHNVANSLATIAAAAAVGATPEAVCQGLYEFQGTGRRFERRGSYHGAVLYDDYAHHPTEVRATLAAAKERYPVRLWAVFQPHTTHRLTALFEEFASAFGDADRAIIVDAYMPPGREREPGSRTSRDLVNAMGSEEAKYIGSLADAEDYLAHELTEGDLVLLMGAGDITRITAGLLEREGIGGNR